MLIRFATKEETKNWNNLVIKNPDGGDIFQTAEFAEIKAKYNWEPRFLLIDKLAVLVLERPVTALGKFWYIPKGPGISDVKQLEKVLPYLKKFAHNQGVFSVRLEPEILSDSDNIMGLLRLGLTPSKPIQAANTVVVDIDKPLDDIVANFTSKARGNIRAAQKAGVNTEIVPINNENCKLFYDMMNATIAGRSFTREYPYFKRFWQSYGKSGNGIFMFAKSAEGDILSMDFIMLLGKKAARKDAASTRDHSVRGASAYLELEMIKYLKDKGITDYDLYGAPPSDQIKNPKHPFYGFGTFKTSFNPHVTDYVGCYDLIVKPFACYLWKRIGERLAKHFYLKKHQDLYF